MHSLIVVVASYAVFLIPVAAALVWLQVPRPQKLALAGVGVLAIVFAVVGIEVAAHVWADPRPFVVDGRAPLLPHAADNGFPSDHTTFAAAIAAALLPWRRRLATGLLLLAAAVGAARVAAHVHHVPDVVGGFLIGTAAAVLAILVVRALLRNRGGLGLRAERHTESTWENGTAAGTGGSVRRSDSWQTSRATRPQTPPTSARPSSGS
ncbi:MAG TPA: phosphatase PAP2 family protein [Intrasporangium sp.]|nr:phosphatase PAP2 family protein [Intrasporangium sp.]